MNESPGCRTSLHSRMWIGSGSLGAALCLIIPMCFVQAAERTQPFSVSYEFNNRLVSVSAQSVPLTDVLHELAAQTGLDIRLDPSVSFKVLQYFQNVPLETAIQRLAGPHKTLLVYGVAAKAQHLQKVHVMARTVMAAPRAAEAKPGLASLDVYGSAWLAAHHDSDPRFLPAAPIQAAVSWQNYLAQLSGAQRAKLHARMLQTRADRTAAAHLAATALP